MVTSLRDRKFAKGEPKGDGRIPRRRQESGRPTPPDKEKAFQKRMTRQEELGAPKDFDLLKLVQDAETISRDYHTATLTQPLATNYRAWNNQHASHSKYLGPGFKGRSRLFVPKTRLAVRKNLATAAAALFSTDDVASVSAVYEDDKAQLATASVMKELLNYRMTRGNTPTSIPWFQICMAGILDAQLTAAVISKQYWEYATAETGEYEEVIVDVVDDDNPWLVIGTAKIKRPIMKTVRDRFMIDLLPIENCSLDPMAPWHDPVGGGRWFRARYPMYVQEAKDMIESMGEEHGFLPVGEIAFEKGRIDDSQRSTTRRSRQAGRDNVQDSRVGAWDPIWLVENFFRVEGRDLHFWTVGDFDYASKVQDCDDVYPAVAGDRPYKMGVATIEGHKIVPMSPVESWQPLQLELNDIANLRLDTLKRSIAPLTKVRRGRKVDLAALLRRGQPEAVIQLDAMDDVEFQPTPPPPGQAYTESSINNALFDELAGVMSTSSVQSNRQLNETVGGMKLLSGAANSVSEFDLRVIVETWVEPVLRQAMRHIQYYESDENALRVAGAKAQAWQRFEYEPSFQDLENTEVSLRVNVGIGSADPMQRLAKMGQALQMLAPIYPEIKSQGITVNGEAIIEEVFGQAGFKDGRRFFTFGEAPEQDMNPELMKIMEELKLKAKEIDIKAKAIELKGQEIQLDYRSDSEDRQVKLQIERERGQREVLKDVIHVAADDQARQEQRLDTHIGRAQEQSFQRESKAQDHGFQREARSADQGFQRETRDHNSMEARVAKMADLLARNGKMPGRDLVPAQPQQVQPAPSGMEMIVPAILERLDQMAQAQQLSSQQTAMVLAKALEGLAKAMMAPKQVVLNAEGRPRGVIPGLPADAILPPRG